MLGLLTLAATVTVSPGDTLSGIASHHHRTWEQLYYANRREIKNPNLIYPGERLVIPGPHSPSLSWHGNSSPAKLPYVGISRHVVYHAKVDPGGVYHTVYATGGTLSYAGLEHLWEIAGGPAWAAPHAAEIAECESGGRQYAYNPSGASGYWQILGEVVPGDVFNPIINAENAVAKFRASGDTFAQWVCT